ncbi:MAG: hypothetical protein ABI333_12085 [bacterium]
MKKLVASAAFLLLVLPAAFALAQGAPPPREPERPADRARPADPARPADRAGPVDPARPADPERPADPSKPPPDTTGDRPAAAPGTEKPGDGGHLPGAGDPFKPGAKKAWPKVMYGLGASFQFNIVPQFFLRAFTKAAKNKDFGVYKPAVGIHFVRRKKLMDMTIRVAFGWFMDKKADGNWLGAGHEWSETDYTEFHNMNFLWADISWTWHTRLAKQFYLAYGTGIGIGWVMGKVYTTNSGSSGQCGDSYSDPSTCRPPDPPGGTPLVCTRDGCTRESLATHPDRQQEKSVPPVLPAINGHIGLRYDFFRHLSMKIEFGIFLPGLFDVKAGLTAWF